MSAAKISSKSPTIRRIMKEAAEISNAPSPDYTAAPLDTDLFEWHFTFRGPPNSVYAEGIYHGRIVLPPTYPLRPPSFRFATPSGRFEVNREICLSISGHHEETWQPAWGVRTALVALRSFMETDPRGQLGGLESSDATRKRQATESHRYRCTQCGKTNEEIIKECEEAAKANEEASEVEVPTELKMGWKDELNAQASEKSDGATSATPAPTAVQTEAVEDAESAELAEGFVRTAPVPTERASPAGAAVPQQQAAPAHAVPVPASSQTSMQARQGAYQPTPTRTVSLPQAPNVRPHYVQQRALNDGVPMWIDRAIVVVIVLLVGMVLRVFLDV